MKGECATWDRSRITTSKELSFIRFYWIKYLKYTIIFKKVLSRFKYDQVGIHSTKKLVEK
jgi:hypothetical protein